MLTIALFAAFLTAYACLFVPAAPQPATVAEMPEPATLDEAPAPTAPEPTAPAQPMTIAPLPELTLTVEELAELAPDYASMGVVQLRKECSARGIQWRRYAGKKATPMSKAEMLALLA